MKSVLTVLVFAFCSSINAQNLVLSKFSHPEYRTIYNGSSFFISVSDKVTDGSILLTQDIDYSNSRYFLVNLSENNPAESIEILKKQSNVLYSDTRIAIVAVNKNKLLKPLPDVHNSLVALNLNNDYKLSNEQKLVIPVDTFPSVYTMVSLVDTGLFMPTIVTLSAIPSRDCITAGCATAQNIIDTKFQALGFSTTLQPVSVGQPAQSNVIAIQTGTVHPNEYVVVGAHYDSYSFSGNAPGADDDASGVAGVLELARILKNFNFERTIVYCAFTAEEYGLYGSEAYAAQCENNNMNIQGYFNFDMIGYLAPGYPVNTDMIYPSSALPLANFYKEVSAIFVPSLMTSDTTLSAGDSDHTSFNNHGFMGIFPFEDVLHYSPFIHSDQDLVGISVNSPAQCKLFIQANLASVATLARPVGPVGIVDQNMPGLQIFPNPASEEINILSPINETVELSIFNAMGEKVFACEFQGKFLLSLLYFPKGIYLVSCHGKGFSATSKFVRQ